jgi:hypothetical protein
LRTLFACGLCLLAVVFAVEAKTAWFGPAFGPGSDVRAAKALPADMPRIIAHGVPVPDPIHPQTPFADLAAHQACAQQRATRAVRDALVGVHLSPGGAAWFSPAVLFRPPPVLS